MFRCAVPKMGVLQIGIRAISYRELVIPIIMANVPPNDPNVDAPAMCHAPQIENCTGSPVWKRTRKRIRNPEEDPEEGPEEDPEDDPEDNNDDDWEVDDEAEVIEPYTGDDLNNPPPPISKDEETPPTSPVIPVG
ncbi:hypothetical protein Tco_0823367 [Tanacetum coccineum]|uniref:Uncharacterized protein n=1 Tax=Tanacetum coccineum TaxID=301880 RepID=A0ABQ5AIP1_9ASTR